jgi:hypothetical protein
MDIQAYMNAMSDMDSKQRSNYHATYGELIKALREADKDTVFDKRVTGISAYRGYYVDIALNTESSGYSTTDEDYDFDNYDADKYREWREKHTFAADKLPSKAHELADVLESLIGKGFEGYKGGWYKISEDKPLWLAEDYGHCSEVAVMAITKDLELVTKKVEL